MKSDVGQVWERYLNGGRVVIQLDSYTHEIGEAGQYDATVLEEENSRYYTEGCGITVAEEYLEEKYHPLEDYDS